MTDKNKRISYTDSEFSEILEKAVELYSKDRGTYDSSVLKETLNEMDIPEEYIRKAKAALSEEKKKKEQKRKTVVFGIIIGAMVILIGGVIIFTLYRRSTPEHQLEQMRKLHYNTLVSLEEDVRSKQAQLENVIDRKIALIPSLITLVREYAEFESSIIKALKDSHEHYSQSDEFMDKIENLAVINTQITDIMKKAETLQAIKSDDLYQNLVFELAGSENRISVEKKRYNDAVAKYNAYARKYPLNRYINDLGFEKEMDYWQK